MSRNRSHCLLSKKMVSAGARIANDDSNGDTTHATGPMETLTMPKTNVKHMFNDVALRGKLAANKMQFSSGPTPMNIDRLRPQVAYYVYAYAQLVKTGQITSGESTLPFQQETLEIPLAALAP